jgi:hypothetical protein
LCDRTRSQNAEVTPTQRENQVNIRAVDFQGLISEKTLKAQWAERRRNIWAVVIGIDRYPKVRPLKYAVDDERLFCHRLEDFSQIAHGSGVILGRRLTIIHGLPQRSADL